MSDTSSRQSSDSDSSSSKAATKEFGKASFRTLFRYRTNLEWLMTLIGALAGFISGGSTPMFMYFFGKMTRYAYDAESGQVATTNYAKLMTCVGVLTMVVVFIKVSTFQVTASRMVGRMKLAYFTSVLSQDVAWHDEHKPGELISHLTGDTRVVQNGINDRMSGVVESFGTGLVGFIFAFIASWELTLCIMAAIPVVGGVTMLLSTATSKNIAITRKCYAQAAAIAQEVMENIKTVQSFNREGHEAQRFAEMVVNSRSAGIKKEFMVVMTSGAAMGIMFCAIGAAFILASYLIGSNRADVGTISACFLSVLYGAMGFGALFPSTIGFLEARTVAYPIYCTIDRVPDIDVDAPGVPCKFNRCIEFKGVSFTYPTRPDQLVVKRLDLKIQKGQKIAFSGSTGCGKSTIIALLQRFYDPDNGKVLVDGEDLRNFCVRDWREYIGIVSQEPNLFSGSVLDNIRLGNPQATLPEVVRACKRARIHDTIVSLPHGYDTSIGAVGNQLSGGQKQRIAIARAIVRGAQILLLDEATSALDRKSEVEVQAALDSLTVHGKMTVVTIAHRLATIRHMDCIYFLDNDGSGSYIAESGTYEELRAMNGKFAAMAMMQDSSSGNLKSVFTNTSFYLYSDGTGKTLQNNYSEEDDSDEDEDLWTGRKDTEFYLDDDEWDKIENREDVPFAHQTQWEVFNTNVSMWRILKMTQNHWWAIVLAFIGSIITAVVLPVLGMMITQLVNVFGNYAVDHDKKKMNDTMMTYVIILFVLGFAMFAGSVLTGFYGFVGEHLTFHLRTMLFQQILRQDATFFDMPRRDAGSLSGVLSGDCESVHQLYGPTLGSRLKSFCSFGAGIVIGMLMEWRVALVALATMPLLVGSIVAQQLFFSTNNKRDNNMDSVVSESLSAIRTVNSFNLKDRMLLRYKRNINVEEVLAEKRTVLISILVGLTELCFMGSAAISFWYGGVLIGKGETTFSAVLVASMAIMMGSSFAGAEAGSFATKIRDARRSANNCFSIIDRVPNLDSYSYGAMELDEACDIEFRNVGFSYPARERVEVLNDLSLTFGAGTSNGLMGQTGCGKSTIVQMLARFYPPTKGKILVNGVDLTTIDIVTWRDQTSLVLQEPCLFSGTILDNIKYSVPDATDEEVYEAAKVACIHDDIIRMDAGYETQVGYRGRELSGGQKQRVAIARGVLRCPKILFLDEATSALDSVTEAAVQANLDSFQREYGVTTVCIAHRLTTIQHSDQIVLLDSGKIIEQGTHADLMEQGGEYKSRWDLTQQ